MFDLNYWKEKEARKQLKDSKKEDITVTKINKALAFVNSFFEKGVIEPNKKHTKPLKERLQRRKKHYQRLYE